MSFGAPSYGESAGAAAGRAPLHADALETTDLDTLIRARQSASNKPAALAKPLRLMKKNEKRARARAEPSKLDRAANVLGARSEFWFSKSGSDKPGEQSGERPGGDRVSRVGNKPARCGQRASVLYKYSRTQEEGAAPQRAQQAVGEPADLAALRDVKNFFFQELLKYDYILVPDLDNLRALRIAPQELARLSGAARYVVHELLSLKVLVTRSELSSGYFAKRAPELRECAAAEAALDHWVVGDADLGFPERLLDHYFDEAQLARSDGVKYVNSRFKFLTRSLLYCLRSGARAARAQPLAHLHPELSLNLNADAINVYLTLLSERYPNSKALVLSTDFLSQVELHLRLTAPAAGAEPLSFAAVLKRWHAVCESAVFDAEPHASTLELFRKLSRFLRKQQLDIFARDFVCWPYHYCGNHWILIVTDMRERAIVWVDSALESYCEAAEKLFADRDGFGEAISHAEKSVVAHPGFAVCELLENFLLYEKVVAQSAHAREARAWRKVVLRGLPQQPTHSVDCGVFMCQFVRSLCKNGDVYRCDYSAKDADRLREGMALAIGAGKIFESYADVLNFEPERFE